MKIYKRYVAIIVAMGTGCFLFYWSAAFWGGLLQVKDQVQFYLEQPISGQKALEILEQGREETASSEQEESELLYEFCIWGEKDQVTLTNDNLSKSIQADTILFCGNIELLFEDCRVPVMGDARGCLVDEQTAWELFGDGQIAGKEISCEGTKYIIRKVIPGKEKIAVFFAGGTTERMSDMDGAGQEERDQRGDNCLDRITILQSGEISLNDLKSAWISRYGVSVQLLDLQFLRGVSGFFVLLVPVTIFLLVLRSFYRQYKRQQEWLWKAVLATASLMLAVLVLFFLKAWVQIPYDYIPEKWSDFSFWTELWKEKQESMRYLIQMQKSILDLKWISSFFKCVVLGILAEVFLVILAAPVTNIFVWINYGRNNKKYYATNPSDMGEESF